MIIPYAVYDIHTGEIARTGPCLEGDLDLQVRADEVNCTVISLRLDLGDGVYVDRECQDDTHWFDKGELAYRPEMGLPPEITVTLGTPISFPGVPPGTVVSIDGTLISEPTTSQGLTLLRSKPEAFVVELSPPFPWIPASCRVEITP